MLDEEIARLAEKYSAPLVLCYLEGKSYDQAARELGLPKSSLTRRLSRAREFLRQRLVRRGVTLSAGALATALCEKVSGAPVGAMLTIKTVKAATSIAAGKAVAGECVSAVAWALAEETTKGLAGANAKLIALALVLNQASPDGLFAAFSPGGGGRTDPGPAFAASWLGIDLSFGIRRYLFLLSGFDGRGGSERPDSDFVRANVNSAAPLTNGRKSVDRDCRPRPGTPNPALA